MVNAMRKIIAILFLSLIIINSIISVSFNIKQTKNFDNENKDIYVSNDTDTSDGIREKISNLKKGFSDDDTKKLQSIFKERNNSDFVLFNTDILLLPSRIDTIKGTITGAIDNLLANDGKSLSILSEYDPIQGFSLCEFIVNFKWENLSLFSNFLFNIKFSVTTNISLELYIFNYSAQYFQYVLGNNNIDNFSRTLGINISNFFIFF